jgi:hypothetical protein
MNVLAALLSPRVIALVAVALALAMGGRWCYVQGARAVQADWDADLAQRTVAALAASEAARAAELALQSKVRKVANDYQVEKTRRAAADLLAADSLRKLQAALAGGGAPGADPAATARADDDPRPGIVAECAAALIGLDKEARRLASQTVALQGYAAGVCVSPGQK